MLRAPLVNAALMAEGIALALLHTVVGPAILFFAALAWISMRYHARRLSGSRD